VFNLEEIVSFGHKAEDLQFYLLVQELSAPAARQFFSGAGHHAVHFFTVHPTWKTFILRNLFNRAFISLLMP
jgi:hypothetical protein